MLFFCKMCVWPYCTNPIYTYPGLLPVQMQSRNTEHLCSSSENLIKDMALFVSESSYKSKE